MKITPVDALQCWECGDWLMEVTWSPLFEMWLCPLCLDNKTKKHLSGQ